MEIVRLGTREEVSSLIKELKGISLIVLDIETDSLNTRQAKILTIQLYEHTRNTAYIFSGIHAICLIDLEVDYLILQNFKYDYAVLYHNGINILDKPFIDIMLLHHLEDENAEHSLDSRVQEIFEDNYKEEFWAKHVNFSDAPQNEQDEYACKDAYYTYKLFIESGMSAYLTPVSQLVHLLAKGLLLTELEGINVDKEYLLKQAKELSGQINAAMPKMRSLCLPEIECIETDLWEKEISSYKTDKRRALVTKPKFNFNSSSQLQTLVYNYLNLPIQKNPKTKNPSLDEEALENLQDKHPLVKLLLDYRKVTKVYGSFIEGTLERLENGKIYPEFHVNGTVTGRLSSSNPNMQQLPTEGGIRGIYIPSPGNCFISADYSQLEVTIAAAFTQDKNLLRVVNEGASLHDITANALGISRSQAKTVNFAMQYGASAFKIARILSISVQEATLVHSKYWDTYRGLKVATEACNKLIDEGKPIVNPFGRARHFPIMKRLPWDKAYRQGFNFLIQSTGADLTNSSFGVIMGRLKHIGRPLFPIHDEILSEIRQDRYEEAKEIIVSSMERISERVDLSLDLKVTCSGALKRWKK